MTQKKSINIGFRGWMLVIYQFIAFFTYTAFTNYPLNILADLYGGATKISTIYTVCGVIGIIIQLAISGQIRKFNIKIFGAVLGLLTLILGLLIMYLPFSSASIWCVCYGFEVVISTMYATFAVSILVGQWFPRRKGTIMGIATIAFPVANGFIGVFATRVFASGAPEVSKAYMPFFIVFLISWLIGVIFIKDYPEQCGCYRDNDKSLTPEIAKAMMEEEQENKKTTVWKGKHLFTCRDFWFMVVPEGFLLMFSVGMMTQTSAILGQFEEELSFVGGYSGVMVLICIFGCVGSYILGLIDTKIGTRKSMIMASAIMLLAGVLGMIPNAISLLISMICLALFMGASSNYTVSSAAQYWRREDFSSVFAGVNPVANVLAVSGPMLIARLFYSPMGYQAIFMVTAAAGVLSIILMILFKPSHVKELDDKYRKEAGKTLDDALAGRK
ncbi:MAG: MFS transporter [Clostridiales bacterium]|nr:MFS transporter [Clostridiales bacterium]